MFYKGVEFKGVIIMNNFNYVFLDLIISDNVKVGILIFKVEDGIEFIYLLNVCDK